MQFQVLKDLVQSMINAMQMTVVEAVKNIKAHTFTVKVANTPSVQKVSGAVTISNPDKASVEVKRSNAQLATIVAFLHKFKFPTEMKVSNFPAFPKVPEFPRQINVGNFPKFPEYPKRMEISNLSELHTENVLIEMGKITKAIKDQKLDPKINVTTPAPEHIMVPAPTVTVTQTEVDPTNLAKAIAKVIPSIDYEKLAKAIAEEISQGMFVGSGGGGGGSNSFRDRDGKSGRALVDDMGRLITSPDYFLSDKSTVGGTIYTGNLALDGRWYMFRVQGDEIRYATGAINGNTDYVNAWTNRATLNYDYADKVAF